MAIFRILSRESSLKKLELLKNVTLIAFNPQIGTGASAKRLNAFCFRAKTGAFYCCLRDI
jgi:hypothetical protein